MLRSLVFGLACAVASACGNGASSTRIADAGGGSGGGMGAAGAPADARGAADVTAGASGAGGVVGLAGAAGAPEDASIPSDSSGGAGPSEAGAGGGDGGVDTSVCPAGSICEGFESYASGASDLGPAWTVYTYGGGALQVDGTKPFHGGKSLHLSIPVGGRKYADIIKQGAGDAAVLPLKHYGRVMVWLTAMPSAAHWAITQAGGILAGTTDMTAKYSWGGQNAKLLPGYAQRNRVIGGIVPLRGGGPEDGDPNDLIVAPVDCSMPVRTETVATKKWVCWEWMVDGATPELHMWLDGQPQTEADVVGKGTACARGPNATWTAPETFSKIIVGWETYTQPSDVANEVWLDDLVMSPERVGCPPP
jgi:hypothetical protein